MKLPSIDDEAALAKILERQKRLAFDFEKSIPWSKEIDLGRFFVPLDQDALVFPHANLDQRRVLSQYLGLVIAQTFSEMETALVQAKDLVWKKHLQRYPVNPEFEALGNEFFSEEEKHSRMFKRYLEKFAFQTGVSLEDISGILPAVSGTVLQKTLRLNSATGGHALWWVLMLVEEVSILIYKQMQPFKGRLDPLYFAIHRKHFEEEVRHSPYSYWMLEHLYGRNRSLLSAVYRKTDLVLSQALEVVWTFSSLSRVRNAGRLRQKHPFYSTLAGCLPMLMERSPFETIKRLFISAPFVSLLLNPNYHGGFQETASKLRALEIPIPKPESVPLGAP